MLGRRRLLQCTMGLLAAPAQDHVIRLVPPLVAGEAEVEEALLILDAVARSAAKAA